MTINLEQVDKQIAFGVAKQYREANRTRLEGVMQEIDTPLNITRHIESGMTEDEIAVHYARPSSTCLSERRESWTRRMSETHSGRVAGDQLAHHRIGFTKAVTSPTSSTGNYWRMRARNTTAISRTTTAVRQKSNKWQTRNRLRSQGSTTWNRPSASTRSLRRRWAKSNQAPDHDAQRFQCRGHRAGHDGPHRGPCEAPADVPAAQAGSDSYPRPRGRRRH